LDFWGFPAWISARIPAWISRQKPWQNVSKISRIVSWIDAGQTCHHNALGRNPERSKNRAIQGTDCCLQRRQSCKNNALVMLDAMPTHALLMSTSMSTPMSSPTTGDGRSPAPASRP
jgi:hypothetical protein